MLNKVPNNKLITSNVCFFFFFDTITYKKYFYFDLYV